MKFVLFIFSCSACYVSAQIINPKITLKNKVNNRINQKIDKGIDKGLDKIEGAAKNGTQNNSNSGNTNTNSNSNGSANNQQTGSDNASSKNTNKFLVYSKYDFVTGDKILFVEDFADDAVGDFPNFWNTNSSGEIVNVNESTVKSLQMNKSGIFTPENINQLPENFTLEFDLEVNPNFSFYSSALSINIASIDAKHTVFDWAQYKPNKHGCAISIHPTGAALTEGNSTIKYYNTDDSKPGFENNVSLAQFQAYKNKTKVHVAIWRQNQRLRVYINEEKVWDLPKVLEATINYNSIVFTIYEMHNKEDKYFISNVKLAVGAPDTRNKLITDGKFVSHGILFDVNSSMVKPSSYGAIKEIANALKDNADVKIKIIGHTDSDGDDKINLELSKKRAAAVKDILVKEFAIDASRIETDGKGEAEPMDKATTAEAKANNRRVEFIKL